MIKLPTVNFQAITSMPEFSNIPCGLCNHELNYGLPECQGCQGTIVYGATDNEVAESANNWSIFFGLGASLLLYVVPLIVNASWSSEIPLGWGFGELAIMGVGVGLFWGYQIGAEKAYAVHSGDVRTFHHV